MTQSYHSGSRGSRGGSAAKMSRTTRQTPQSTPTSTQKEEAPNKNKQPSKTPSGGGDGSGRPGLEEDASQQLEKPLSDKGNGSNGPSHEEDESKPIKIISKAEDGTLDLLEVERIAKILAEAEEPDETVADIFREAALYQDEAEKFQVWLSHIWDLVVDKELWKGRHETFADWVGESQNATCNDIAKAGRRIRSKKAEATNALVSLGCAGPRFQYLVQNKSQNFLQAVRQQMSNHRISYPLTTALANLKTYHRIAPGGTGKRGVQRTPCTQTCDITGLDVLAYRPLTTEELDAAGVQLGPHGFLINARSTTVSIEDPEFSRAIQSFEAGKRAAEQSSPYARAAAPTRDKGKEGTGRAETPISIRPLAFAFVTQCTCPPDVDADLKAALDKLSWKSGYAELEPLIDRVNKTRATLCVRHCQLWLVRGLGVPRLRSKTNRDSLAEDIEKYNHQLKEQVAKQPETGQDFSAMKKGLVFSWDDIRVPKKVLGKRAFSGK